MLKTDIKTQISVFIGIMIAVVSVTLVSIEVYLNHQSVNEIKNIQTFQMNELSTKVIAHHLRVIAQVTSKNLVQPLYDFNFSELKRLAGAISDSEHFQYLYIVNEKGVILFDGSKKMERIGRLLDDPKRPRPLPRKSVELRKIKGGIEISAPILLEDQLLGVLLFGYATSDVERIRTSTDRRIQNLLSSTRSRFIDHTILTTALLTVLAVVLGSFILNRMLNPITALQRATRKIAKGNFDIHLPTDRTDEIGSLAVSFNQMAASLETSKKAVKQAHLQLTQSAKLASIGELSAGIAHEINQPLMVIRLKAQLLERKLKNGAAGMDQGQLLKEIQSVTRQTKRIMEIIKHLRIFSRQSEQEFCPVDVNSVIDDCFLMIAEQLNVHDIRVVKQLDPFIPKVMANSTQLEQVILNLLSNSRQAIETKRIEKVRLLEWESTITISTSAYKDTVKIRVGDGGCGIQKEHAHRIFDPFFTTKGPEEGTGLGLSISYGIIRDHKGSLEIIETGPGGTVFCATLPNAPD